MDPEVVKLEGDDVAGAIARFARERRVSLLIVGKSTRSWWHRVWHGSVVDKLVQATDGLDVLVVSFDEPVPNGARRDGGDDE